MKKTIAAFLLSMILLLALPLSASAEHFHGGSGWTVTFTTANKMVSNFGETAIDDFLRNLQPGDDMSFSISLVNSSGKTIDWYMLNEIIKSLEDSTIASGGSYSYILTYTSSSGTTKELYNSNTVGGEGIASSIEGLHEVDTALKNYMFLETMQSGRSGTVYLSVALEGESQGNSYQDTKADLRLRFAAEVVPTKTIVKTGDDGMNINPIIISMGVAGAVALGLAIAGAVENKKKRGQKT